MDDAGVVATLGDGEGLIGLHADQGEIRGGAEDGAEAAGGETGAGFLREGQGSALVHLLEVVDELGVDAEARGGVGGLAEKTGGETLFVDWFDQVSDGQVMVLPVFGTRLLGVFERVRGRMGIRDRARTV